MKKFIAIAVVIFAAQTTYSAVAAKSSVEDHANARVAQIEAAIND